MRPPAERELPGTGAVYEISGPFRLPPAGAPASPFGLPAGDGGAVRSGLPPGICGKTARRIAHRSLLRRGLPIEVSAPAGTRVSAVLDTADLARTRGPHGTTDRPRTVKLARRHLRGTGKAEPRRLRLGRTARRRLTGRRGPVAARLLVVAVTSSGRRLSAVRHVRISR